MNPEEIGISKVFDNYELFFRCKTREEAEALKQEILKALEIKKRVEDNVIFDYLCESCEYGTTCGIDIEKLQRKILGGKKE